MAGIPKVTARQNIDRALSHLGMLSAVYVVEEREDRIIARYAGVFATYVRSAFDRDPGKPALHPGATESWREPGAVMPALQVCFRQDGLAEIDLDLAAPLGGDLASLVVHGIEVVVHWFTGRKSNQQRMAAWLDRRFGNEVNG